MLIRQVFVYILLFLSLSISAQQFVALDWQQFPPAHTLPRVTEELPLENDFPHYTYQVKIEYPEFETLPEQEASELRSRNITLPDFPQVETLIRVSAHKGFLTAGFVPVVFRDGIYQRITSFKLSLSRTPVLARHSSFQQNTDRYAARSVLSEGKFVKVRVRNDGIYRIGYNELRQMGFSAPEKVKVHGYGGHILSQRFQEHPADDLPQAPCLHSDNSLLFYARGVISWKPVGNDHFARQQNFYSEYSYYFLTDSGDTVKGLSGELSLPDYIDPITTFNAYALYEKEGWSWASTGRELYDDYDYVAGNTRQYSFTLPGITGEEGRITAEFSAKSVGPDTSFSLSLNGEQKGTKVVDGITFEDQYYTKATSATMDISWIGEKTQETNITLTHNRPAGTSGRLNYIALNYNRSLYLNEPFITFRSLKSVDKESTFVLSGTDSSTLVWDVTSPANCKQMEIVSRDGTSIFTIPAGPLREFVAFNPKGNFESVEVVGEVPNQNLHALSGIDMIILVPDKKSFIEQAERLAQAHRTKDNLTVEVVTATQVYNEFSSGTPDATAYRRLMKMLYDRSSGNEDDTPKYLLLFGDCSYDNRLLSSKWKNYKTDDFLLCYQSESSLIELNSYVTDDYFGFLDDNEGSALAADKLDIGIGRFPVRTAAEAQVAVDKTIAYMENKQAGPWKNTIAYLADDGDENLHARQAEILAGYTEKNHPNFLINRIYEDAYKREATSTGYSYKDATKRLLQLFDQGMLLVNFTGHGSTTAWTAENLLTADDINKLTSPRLPLWITATCDFTRFDDVNTSAGELAFLNPKGGAIALFTTSRVVYASQNSTLNQAFIKHTFSRPEGKRLRLGDIMRLSKCDISLDNDRNKLNFSLIGDPALTLSYPDYQIKVDGFNGPLTEEFPMIKAGGKVTVKGHILDPDGQPAHNFEGTVHPTVFDSEEEVTTRNNLGEGAFKYKERNKILFAGSDVVAQGQFEFTFPVPLDINYSDMQGMLNLYALDTSTLQEAGGHFDRFLVGGTEGIDPSDTDGPSLKLYLNTTTFVSGGKVNHTPLFIAEIEDPDGINTVGNGIGHDLTLCIDGKAALTYSLNNYYTPLPGDYTRGTVHFPIPELPEGAHTLSFRAWDLLNNSSTETLDFEVVKGLRPDLISITCTNSPARDNTSFILTHNRPGSELDIRISLFDFAGRELWIHTERSVASGQEHTVDWDLCDTNGRRLSPGIYLYRASVSSDGSKESTKTQKILILAQ